MTSNSIDEVDAFYIEVGRRIRGARGDRGLTQADLAERVGLTRTSVTNLEAGRQRMPLHIFATLADALGVEPAQLLAPFEKSTNALIDRALDKHLSTEPSSMREFIQALTADIDPTRRKEVD